MANTRQPARTSRIVKKKTAPKKAVVTASRTRRPQVVRQPVRQTVRQPVTQAVAPPPPVEVKKPGFYQAVAIYERGVQALQRHDFEGAAGHFRAVVDNFPEERELLERARLYLRVCERETERRQPPPKSPAEHVYAATVALNSGDPNGALDHLHRALNEDPESDHAHYIMAVALGSRGRVEQALDHLRRAIALNPENRSLAKQDPDLEGVRTHVSFRSVLDTPPVANRRRFRASS
jgi:predicted Zn-dependent protease